MESDAKRANIVMFPGFMKHAGDGVVTFRGKTIVNADLMTYTGNKEPDDVNFSEVGRMLNLYNQVGGLTRGIAAVQPRVF